MSSVADFSQIAELREFRRLYEEQEEKTGVQLDQKDELIEDLRSRLQEQQESSSELETRIADLRAEIEKLEGERVRTARDHQEKTEKLMDRIKELNQKLVAS